MDHAGGCAGKLAPAAANARRPSSFFRIAVVLFIACLMPRAVAGPAPPPLPPSLISANEVIAGNVCSWARAAWLWILPSSKPAEAAITRYLARTVSGGTAGSGKPGKGCLAAVKPRTGAWCCLRWYQAWRT